ncbi:MAG: VOC family protein, partial [Clostridia bacterium]|nr:VOC family protein [Clostridia bacterium]
MKFNKLIPELSVSNIEKSQNFYTNILKFKIEYSRPSDKFVFISYNGSQIMLEQINQNWNTGKLEKPFGRGINFQIETNEIFELKNRLLKSNYPLFKDIFESNYKANNEIFKELEFLVLDP